MSRHVIAAALAAVLVVGLSSCSRGRNEVPRDAEDACAILAQYPEYGRAFRDAESRWGLPVPVQMAVIYQESTFRSRARPPRKKVLGFIPGKRPSSAYGYVQAIDGAWEDYVSGEGRRLARRDNINDAADFMGWYMTTTARVAGVSLKDAERQYLAYHEGHTGYRRGSYQSKTWLLDTARRVGERAAVYEVQLTACGQR